MTLPGQITSVHTVGVPVTDQDRAIDFTNCLWSRQQHQLAFRRLGLAELTT